MNNSFAITHRSREILLQFLDGYSLEQLNKIPPGFSNNLIWNIAHIIVVEQMLVYKLSGLGMMVSEQMADSYKRGSRPLRDLTASEIAEIRSLLFSTIQRTEQDYNNNVFIAYNEFTTTNGFKLTNAAEAIVFNAYHEGIHLGIMMAIRKFI